MPDVSGTELLAQMRQLRPDLPAILVSGYGGPDLQAQAAVAGVQAILTKPLHAAELAACLATVLAARPAPPAHLPSSASDPQSVARPTKEEIS